MGGMRGGGNDTNYNGSKANRREQRRVKNRVHECSVAGGARGIDAGMASLKGQRQPGERGKNK